MSSISDENLKKYTYNEISILKEVDHPNIEKLIEVKEQGEKIYIVREYCNGGSLSEFVKISIRE